MSNEIYLYGLTDTGKAPFKAHTIMEAREDVPARWIRLATLPEALAAPKMREALERIAGLKEKEFEFPADWQDQINACPECQGWAKNHPIQNGICNTHRQPLYAREKHDKRQEVMIGYDAKSIAREALAACAPGYTAPIDARLAALEAFAQSVADGLAGNLEEMARAALRGSK